MVNREQVLEIISGRRMGCWGSMARLLLGALTPVYRFAIAIRNFRFDRAQTSRSTLIKSVSVPVISVGNLTTGGTGKTPMVVYLCERIVSSGTKVAIVSRGYGARNKNDLNDEAMELKLRLPTIPHVQSPDRYRAAQAAIRDYGSQVIVLDDGFQHRQLHRDLDIVLIDCSNPFGFNRLLPRGLLREPLKSLKRCQIIVLTRCELVSESFRENLAARVRDLNPTALVAYARTVPNGWLQFDGSKYPLDHLSAKPSYFFCGIGNPEAFFSSLQRLSVVETGKQGFPDHHLFSQHDLERIGSAAKDSGAAAIICTHKDLVKIQRKELNGVPVYCLLIEIELVSGGEPFLKKVREAI